MEHRIFVVFDSKAGAYMPPWFLPREAMAVRAFGDLCNDGKHPVGAHPEDYILFCIGSFDDQTAAIDSFAPKSLCTGIELVVVQDSWPKSVDPKDYDGEDHAMLAERKLEKCDA